jgi:hypothetical protein
MPGWADGSADEAHVVRRSPADEEPKLAVAVGHVVDRLLIDSRTLTADPRASEVLPAPEAASDARARIRRSAAAVCAAPSPPTNPNATPVSPALAPSITTEARTTPTVAPCACVRAVLYVSSPASLLGCLPPVGRDSKDVACEGKHPTSCVFALLDRSIAAWLASAERQIWRRALRRASAESGSSN